RGPLAFLTGIGHISVASGWRLRRTLRSGSGVWCRWIAVSLAGLACFRSVVLSSCMGDAPRWGRFSFLKETGMKPNRIIVKFEDVAEQVNGPVKRLVGFVLAKNMLSVFDAADLEANPRSAKAGAVTQAIIESIETDSVIFPFKTKGVLLGSSSFD